MYKGAVSQYESQGEVEHSLINAIDTKRAMDRRFSDEELEAYLISAGHRKPHGTKTRAWASRVLMGVIRGHATAVMAGSILDITKWSDMDADGKQHGMVQFAPVMDTILPKAPREDSMDDDGEAECAVIVIRKRYNPMFPPVPEEDQPSAAPVDIVINKAPARIGGNGGGNGDQG